MSDDLVDDEDGHEEEGVEAFNRMSDAMHGLQSHLLALDAGMGRKFAQAEQAASKAETAALNARQAAERADATAGAKARSAASWAVLGAVAGVLAAGGAGYWLGHASGQESGLADGYRAAVEDKAAVGWGNTPNGKLAFELDRLGSLNKLIACSEPGWKVDKRKEGPGRACFVSKAPDGQNFGWLIP